LRTCRTRRTEGEKRVTAVTSPWQSRQVSFGSTTISLEVVPVERRYVGHTTASVELRSGDGLFGVIKDEGQFLLKGKDGEIPLESGDSLVISRKID